MDSLSLIIPVFNGEKIIQKTIMEYFNHFSREFDELEIIVVCNACTDRTAEKCYELQSDVPLKVLIEPKRGKGHALIKGFHEAKYNIVGFLDYDNPFDLQKISKMISLLDINDVVIVTKFKKGDLKVQTSFSRRILSVGNAIVSRIVFGMNFQDTQAGAKFIRRHVWENIDKNFSCTGFEFDIEFLYKIQKNNFKIAEYFLLPKKSDFSTVKMRIIPGILYRLLKMRILK